MKKIRMNTQTGKTLSQGFEEYILDCKALNLREQKPPPDIQAVAFL